MSHLNEIQNILRTVENTMETIVNDASMNITIIRRFPEGDTNELSVFKKSDDLYRINDLECTKSLVVAQVSLFLIKKISELYSYSIALSTKREESDSEIDLSYWFIESHNNSNPSDITQQLFLLRKFKTREPEQNIGLTSWI